MTVSLGIVIGLSHNETDMALYQYSTYVQENELYLHTDELQVNYSQKNGSYPIISANISDNLLMSQFYLLEKTQEMRIAYQKIFTLLNNGSTKKTESIGLDTN